MTGKFGTYEISGWANGMAFTKAGVNMQPNSTGEKTAVNIYSNYSSGHATAVAQGLSVEERRCGIHPLFIVNPGGNIPLDNGKYFWDGLRATVTNNGGTVQNVVARVLFLASDKVKIASFNMDLGTIVLGKSKEIHAASDVFFTWADDVRFCDLEL